MSITSKQLREQRAALVARSRQEILDPAEKEGRNLTAEEQQAWDRIMGGIAPDGTAVKGEIDALADRIRRIEAVEAQEQEQARHAEASSQLRRELLDAGWKQTPTDGLVATEQDRSLALAGWMRHQMGLDLSDEQAEACRLTGLRPDRKVLNLASYDTDQLSQLQALVRDTPRHQVRDRVSGFHATLTTTPGSGGGYTIPPETLMRSLEVNMLWFGGVRQVASTMVTATGERISWPTANDTSNTGRRLGASAAIATTTDPSFGKVFWDAYKYTSDAVLVPYELLQDTAVNLPQVIGEMLGERLGRITNTDFTTGTGAAMPKGIVTAASAFAAAAAGAIAADDLLGLYHAVDPAYRAGFGWMCNDAVVLVLRKLKDGEGQYLWQSGLRDGAPDRLLGGPLTINNDMDSALTTGKKSILGGQLSRYKIRRVSGVRMYRLEERYRDNDQDGFLAFVREDGNLLDAGTASIKILTHP